MAGADPVVLTLNHQFPADTPGSKVDQWFADQVYQKTKGEVRIRIFWSNALGDPRENLSLLERGQVDMAAMSAGYFPDELPLLAAPNSIPMAMDNVCQAADIMARFLADIPEVEQEALSKGVRPLFFHVLNPYLLATREPLKRLSDFSGRRIRTWGNDMPELVRAAGATPVPLFLPDIRRAMEKGVIDGCPFSVDLMVSYKLYEFARHVTEVVMWEGPSWGLWVSEATWKKLMPDHRAVFRQTAGQAGEKDVRMALAAEKEARQFLEHQGVTFHPFPAKDLADWKASAPDFMQTFVERGKKIGKEAAARKMRAIWEKGRQKVICP